MSVPRFDQSQDNYLEGTSVPQIPGQTPKSDFKTTINNTGTFHDSNLSHIDQGNYGTVNHGNIGSIVNMVNENGVSGAVNS